MVEFSKFYDKVLNQFHKTRLTHEVYLKLEPEEVGYLLEILHFVENSPDNSFD